MKLGRPVMVKSTVGALISLVALIPDGWTVPRTEPVDVRGGDKTIHWNASVLLSVAE